MENGFLNGLKCILWGKDFNERGSSPFCTYISLFSTRIWHCVVYDSNFDLHLQLQYSKGNNEDITMTYTISKRGSVLRLTDSSLSMYI